MPLAENVVKRRDVSEHRPPAAAQNHDTAQSGGLTALIEWSIPSSSSPILTQTINFLAAQWKNGGAALYREKEECEADVQLRCIRRRYRLLSFSSTWICASWVTTTGVTLKDRNSCSGLESNGTYSECIGTIEEFPWALLRSCHCFVWALIEKYM